MAWEINFPTDTTELSSVATDDLLPIYDVSAPWDLKEVQAVNVAKTVINDASTWTDRVWSASKVNSYAASISWTQTLTNKTIDADNNTISNLEVDNFKTGVIDTDLTSVALTDTTIPSSKATKAMWDTKVSLTGDQTIAGIKTFSSFPVTPSSSPTSDYEVCNKKYTDDRVSSVYITATTRDLSTATWTQVIAHWLWFTPKIVEVTCIFQIWTSPWYQVDSIWWYNWTTNACVYRYLSGATNISVWNSTAYAIYSNQNWAIQTWTITVDSTNITINWIKTGSPTWTAQLFIKAR